MEAEGYEESIDKMIQSIEQGRYIVIENLRVKETKPTGERYFRILD
jgi:acylphosphatase